MPGINLVGAFAAGLLIAWAAVLDGVIGDSRPYALFAALTVVLIGQFVDVD